MKSLLSIIGSLTLALFAGTVTAGSLPKDLQGNLPYQIATIDSGDTVIFDLVNVIITGNQIQVPVMFNSDDLVYSFDFSFRYNEFKLTYDTILTAPAGAGILSFSYKNPADSIVRFTSSNLVALTPLTPIVYIVFDIQSGQTINASDINSVKGYLNGDACASFVIPPLSSGVSEIGDTETISVFPNPATTSFCIHTTHNGTFEVLDLNGRLMVPSGNIRPAEAVTIDCQAFPAGQFLIRIHDDSDAVTYRRIIVGR